MYAGQTYADLLILQCAIANLGATMPDQSDDRLLDFMRGCLVLFVLLATGSNADTQISGMKPFKYRVEGTTVRQNALEDLVVLAIHRRLDTFKQNANLNVRFFLPTTLSPPELGSVSVEALEREPVHQYSMRSKGFPWQKRWNVFQPWPTQDVIDALGLRADQIAVCATYENRDGQLVYLPADIYESPHGFAHGSSYTFYFRAGRDLQSLDISVGSETSGQTRFQPMNFSCDTQGYPNCVRFGPGKTHSFDIDFSKAPEGEYYVKIVGRVPNNSRQRALQINLYHHPSP